MRAYNIHCHKCSIIITFCPPHVGWLISTFMPGMIVSRDDGPAKSVFTSRIYP